MWSLDISIMGDSNLGTLRSFGSHYAAKEFLYDFTYDHNFELKGQDKIWATRNHSEHETGDLIEEYGSIFKNNLFTGNYKITKV